MIKKTNWSTPLNQNNLVRLNKYIANSGLCSRREADELIKTGKVLVNNNIVVELGVHINKNDKVTVNGKKIKNQQNEYYVINKPKGYYTTSKLENNRNSIVKLIKEPIADCLFSIDEVDKYTTGVLILSNDEQLKNQELNVEKVYKVVLSAPLQLTDLNTLLKGIKIEDTPFKPEQLVILEKGDGKEIGISFISAKDPDIHKYFKSIGYKVEYMDRTLFAGITKKNLKRGQYRKLTFREISMLKQSNKRKV